MKVFLTGATGLLGREIAERLLDEGFEITALCRDLTSSRLLKVPGNERIQWVEGNLGDLVVLREAMAGADYVIHAAAMVSFDPKDRKKLYHTNVEGTSNMVNAALLHPAIRKFIHISSVASMSPSKPMPAELDERQGFNPDAQTSDYAWSKYNGELEVVRAVEEGLKAVMLNPSIILAPGQPEESSAVLFEYVRKQRPFYPEGWLNYVDVRDVAQLAVRLLNTGPDSGERFIVSAGHIPYKDFFGKLAAVMGKRAPSWPVPKWMTSIAWRLESIRCFFSGKKPVITKFTAASSAKRLIYKGKSLHHFWPDFRYHTLDESLRWIIVKSE